MKTGVGGGWVYCTSGSRGGGGDGMIFYAPNANFYLFLLARDSFKALFKSPTVLNATFGHSHSGRGIQIVSFLIEV